MLSYTFRPPLFTPVITLFKLSKQIKITLKEIEQEIHLRSTFTVCSVAFISYLLPSYVNTVLS